MTGIRSVVLSGGAWSYARTVLALLLTIRVSSAQEGVTVTDTETTLRIETPDLSAAVNKKGYVTGIQAGTFIDRKTGAHDLGFGLDIVDWIMEPGSDEAYRDKLDPELVENLGMSPVTDPEDLARLAARATTCLVVPDAQHAVFLGPDS